MLPFLLLAPINLNFQAWQTQLNNWHRDKWFLKDKVQLSLPQDSFYLFFFIHPPKYCFESPGKAQLSPPAIKVPVFPVDSQVFFSIRKFPVIWQLSSKLGANWELEKMQPPQRPQRRNSLAASTPSNHPINGIQLKLANTAREQENKGIWSMD